MKGIILPGRRTKGKGHQKKRKEKKEKNRLFRESLATTEIKRENCRTINSNGKKFHGTRVPLQEFQGKGRGAETYPPELKTPAVHGSDDGQPHKDSKEKDKNNKSTVD